MQELGVEEGEGNRYDFILVGGGAFTMYTGIPCHDIDVIVLKNGRPDRDANWYTFEELPDDLLAVRLDTTGPWLTGFRTRWRRVGGFKVLCEEQLLETLKPDDERREEKAAALRAALQRRVRRRTTS